MNSSSRSGCNLSNNLFKDILSTETVNNLQLALGAAAAAFLTSLVATTDERKKNQHNMLVVLSCHNSG